MACNLPAVQEVGSVIHKVKRAFASACLRCDALSTLSTVVLLERGAEHVVCWWRWTCCSGAASTARSLLPTALLQLHLSLLEPPVVACGHYVLGNPLSHPFSWDLHSTPFTAPPMQTATFRGEKINPASGSLLFVLF